jgi:hypothetical protein
MKLPTVAAALALATLPALAPSAHAITLAPGQTATPDLLSLSPNDEDYYLYRDGIPSASAVPIAVIGQGGYAHSVIINTVTKKLSFDWSIGYSPLAPLESISFDGYAGYSVDAGYESGTNTFPISVSRSLDGDRITYTFDTASSASPSRIDLLLRTDATDFYNGSSIASLQFAGTPTFQNPYSLNADQPAPFVTSSGPVPEPASLATLFLATGALALRLRRRV